MKVIRISLVVLVILFPAFASASLETEAPFIFSSSQLEEKVKYYSGAVVPLDLEPYGEGEEEHTLEPPLSNENGKINEPKKDKGKDTGNNKDSRGNETNSQTKNN